MNLQQLRYLRETARRGLNLTQAAAALHTSQPGLSKAIRELEDELGVQVFVRHGKRLTAITDEGHEVLAIAERLLTEAENLKSVGRELRGADTGVLRLAATHTQARYVLPPAVLRLREAFPGVRLQLRQGSPAQIVAMLRAGEVDLGVATELLGKIDELESETLFSWHHCVIAPSAHAVHRHERLDLALLAGYPLVTYDAQFAGRTSIDAAFTAAGLTPDVVLEAADADVIKAYAALGLGVGIVTEMAMRPEGEGDLWRVRAAPTELFPLNTTRVAYRRGRLPRRYERAFIGWLKDEGTQLAAPRQQGGELSAPSNPPLAGDFPRVRRSAR